MIYIPNNNVNHIKNTDSFDILIWIYDNHQIIFKWCRSPKYNKQNDSISYIKDYDPFYLNISKLDNIDIHQCECSCFPQLRYNDIIKKFYCNCSSSAICTKNNDEDELKELLQFVKDYNELNGFFNNPIDAITFWQNNN